MGLPWNSAGKESACSSGDSGVILGMEDPLEEGMATYYGILDWRTPMDKRSLAGYSPWCCKGSETTEPLGIQRYLSMRCNAIIYCHYSMFSHDSSSFSSQITHNLFFSFFIGIFTIPQINNTFLCLHFLCVCVCYLPFTQ